MTGQRPHGTDGRIVSVWDSGRARWRPTFAGGFILLVVAAVALAVLVGGWGTYLSIRQVLLEEELKELSSEAALATRPLENLLVAARADVAIIEQSPPVPALIRAARAGGVDPVSGDDVATWRARLDTIALAVIRNRPEYQRIRFLDVLDGPREVVSAERNGAAGVRLASADELRAGADLAGILESLELGRPRTFVSDPRLLRDEGTLRVPWVPVMTVARPVLDEAGALLGALVIDVDLRQPFAEIRSEIPQGWQAYVVNDRGDFLLHPDTTRTFGFELGERVGLEREFASVAEAFAGGVGRSGSSFLTDRNGSEAGLGLYQWAFDPGSPDRYLGVVLAEDYATFAGSAAAARNRAVSLAMLVLPVAVLFGWMMVRRVTTTLGAEPRELEAVSATIAEGTLDVALPGRPGHRRGVLASLEGMLEHLRSARDDREEKTWVRTNVADLVSAAQRSTSEQELASAVIGRLAEVLDAAQALFYSASPEDGDGRLHLTAAYAYDSRKQTDAGIAFGEGLVGQAAADRKIHEMRDVPESYLAIGSGLGRAAPTTIIAAPLEYEQQTLAVMELATFHDFDGRKGELLAEVAEDLSVILWGLRGRQRAQTLMRSAQGTAEELQAANEELRVTNEELEMRSEELRRQSEELQALNVELEEKSEELERREAEAERRRLLIEKQHEELERTTRQLEEASKYKSEFLANMSHELRTPLNSLLILSQGLSENESGNLTPDQVRSAQIIHSGGEELLELINDILDLSKIEAGKVEIHSGRMDVRDLVSELARQFEPVAERSGVELHVDVDESLPRVVTTDRQRAAQVLKNFLSNAFKFTKQGSVTLTAERRGSDVAFRVRDEGIGIPSEKQQLIFEAFQQADGSTSREYGGTGLGLTISRNLSRLLGGSIELESTEGVGSTFSLVLPIEETGPPETPDEPETDDATARAEGGHLPDTRPAPEPPAPEPPASAEPEPGPAAVDPPPTEDWIEDDRFELDGRRPILIVEDDRALAEILTDLARSRGHAVVATPSGRRAMRLAKAHDPLAVVLDLNLPDVSGLDVLTFFKEDLATRHVPVHAISAHDDRIASLSAGAVGFAAKPSDEAQLEGVFSLLEEEAGDRPKEVLVIEDDDVAARALVDALSVEGVTVTHVGTLDRARRALSEKRFDCVVLDLRLPDGNGIDFLEAWKRNGGAPLPPVIVHTAQELDETTYRRLRSAAEEIVLKGVSSVDRVLDEVTIFLHTLDSALSTHQRSALLALHDSDQTIRGKRVLVVDDDLRNSFALSQALSKRGLDVTLAEDGQQALERLHDDPDFDIVLMDVMMPRMDGYEAMRRLRSDPRFKSLPIIALTAKAMPMDRQRCLDAGANDYLSKPVDVNRLLSVMRVWMFGS